MIAEIKKEILKAHFLIGSVLLHLFLCPAFLSKMKKYIIIKSYV